MRLISLEIPDEAAELAPWLERHLVGPDLAALVAELEAVHGPSIGAQPPVKGLLGRDLDAVLESGLGSLPPATLKRFLRQPRLLLELQELVLFEGGRHWERVALEASGELAVEVERGRKRLKTAIARDSDGSSASILPMPPRVAWYRHPLFVAQAAAAAVLLGVYAYEQSRPANPVPIAVVPQGWGWNKPGALPEDLKPGPYLARLADDAEEWFARKPEDARALARRLNEFRQGCSTLILADHAPLAPIDRQWLVGKCREWASKLDANLTAIEAADPDLNKIQAEADETIRKLIEALRTRAAGLA
jgi:hypothetical protein